MAKAAHALSVTKVIAGCDSMALAKVPLLHQIPWLVQVNQFNVHKGAVHDLSFDETVEFVASCSEDCTVLVSC